MSPRDSLPPAAERWSVHKFGGTCLADADRVRRVAELSRERTGRAAIVVSAMAGTTDALIRITELAAAGDDGYQAALTELEQRTLRACDELFGEREEPVGASIGRGFESLAKVLSGIHVAHSCPPSTRDFVAGFGELWSAAMLTPLLREQGFETSLLDAREVLVIRHACGGPAVDWETSEERFGAWLAAHPCDRLVITGFRASAADGAPTTLGRNGSDHSAAIFARLIDAARVTIWTDVDGVMTADPRRVPEAQLVPELSYEEAAELAYFGASVLHPETMRPVAERGIPVRIMNFRKPEGAGTTISARGARGSEGPTERTRVKGLTLVDGLALLNLVGSGLIGVPGVASRFFHALRTAGVSVTMISQASSEHSISVVVPFARAQEARLSVRREFAAERAEGQVRDVEISDKSVILAAVGDGMVDEVGVAAQFFSALARAGVSVRAIAQGSSERNISVVLAEKDATRAVRAAHAGFYLARERVAVGLIGPGLVGAELITQIAANPDACVRVRGIANSRRMLLGDPVLELDDWRTALKEESVPLELDVFVQHVKDSPAACAVLIDCTASQEIAAHYVAWLERELHVVTPNKRANTQPYPIYRRLRELGGRASSQYLYEATVAAGLPVISTLRELQRTGDRIQRLEGVLSGSLSFILQALDEGRGFSQAVFDARAEGFTEPDPREDLSGLDVARKAVILAREIGFELELEDVRVEGLVPEGLDARQSVDDFLRNLPRHDEEMHAKLAAIGGEFQVVRYVALVQSGSAQVGLRAFAPEHPFARISDGDNVLMIWSERYDKRPLVVQGPGAGSRVTAAGVFGDLLRLAGPELEVS